MQILRQILRVCVCVCACTCAHAGLMRSERQDWESVQGGLMQILRHIKEFGLYPKKQRRVSRETLAEGKDWPDSRFRKLYLVWCKE